MFSSDSAQITSPSKLNGAMIQLGSIRGKKQMTTLNVASQYFLVLCLFSQTIFIDYE